MITVLADHNIEGQATVLWDTLMSEGWLDLYPMRLVRISDDIKYRMGQSMEDEV